MKKVSILAILAFSSCSPIWKSVGDDIEEIATDEVVKITVDKGAMQKDTDIQISVSITNKDQPAAAPVINVLPSNKS